MWLLAVAPAAHAEGEKFAVLHAGAQTFTNVTVISQTRRDVYISHAGGFLNLKVEDLDLETQRALGYAAPAPEPLVESAPSVAESVAERVGLNPDLEHVQIQAVQQFKEHIALIKRLLIPLAAALFLFYLFWCYCSKLICEKAGHAPGFLIWIPVLQMLPLLRAAGLPGWAFLFWLLPISSPVVTVMWFFKICAARGKNAALGLLFFLPVTNIILYLYLAFSGTGEAEESPAPQAGQLVLR